MVGFYLPDRIRLHGVFELRGSHPADVFRICRGHYLSVASDINGGGHRRNAQKFRGEKITKGGRKYGSGG